MGNSLVFPGMVCRAALFRESASHVLLIATVACSVRKSSGQYLIQDHELRFGVTIVPVLIALIGTVQIIRLAKSSTVTRVLLMAVLMIFMGIPVVLSVPSPEWHNFLKSIPYLKDTSLALRWLALDIPIIIVGACVIAHRSLGANSGMAVAVTGILIVLVSHIAFQRPEDARYNPETIVAAYNAVKAGEPVKPISQVMLRDRSKSFLNNGDEMTEGRTVETCYEPIFGYRLGNYPKKQHTHGSVFAQTDGYLNLKNPACYVFPEENACEPGDHFLVEELTSARLFASYQPINFNQSKVQEAASWVSLLTLVITSMSLVLLAFFRKHQ